MLNIFKVEAFQSQFRKIGYWFVALILVAASTTSLLTSGRADAATLTSRSVVHTSSQPDLAGVNYRFTFTTTASTTIQSVSLQFCDTPLGSCVLPGTDGTPTAAEKMDVSHVTANITGDNWQGTQATDFTEYTGADAGGCTESDGGSGVATQYCATRTEAAAEAIGGKTFTVSSISNPIIPSGNNEEVYVRIRTYTDTAFATEADSGTVAAAIVNQLTVTGRVQERLVFCAFALDDAAGSSGTVGTASGNFPTSCAATEATASTNVDVGVIDNLNLARSPVDNSPPSSLGNDRFGALLTNTNASLGVALSYYATTASSGTEELRAFRVAGATCTAGGTSTTDQCFISADDSAGETFTAGTERFGVQMACITNSDTTTAGTTKNLGTGGNGSGTGGTFNTVYANTDTTQDNLEDNASDDCENQAGENKYGWRDPSGATDFTTAQPLISSTTVVDDELVKLRFAATANATTPTGTYTVGSTYIATATF